jgi:predicted metal-dependent hydrolase
MRVRKVKFDLQKKLVRHYFKGNVFSTHLSNSLHIIFPEGEKFFIRSCRKFLDRIDDPTLKQEVIDFMGQEGMHSAAHKDFWQYLEKQGFKVQPFVNFFNRSAFGGVEKAIYSLMGEELGSTFSLAITAGLEHYTALLAEVAFENENEFKHLPDEMRHLLFWHAAEEIEHKSVAFDLLSKMSDSQLIKNTGFTMASLMLFFYAVGGQLYFTVQDEESSVSDWPAEFLDFAESLGSPMAKKFLTNIMAYYKSDYHPSQLNNDHFAVDFFSKHERYQSAAAEKRA